MGGRDGFIILFLGKPSQLVVDDTVVSGYKGKWVKLAHWRQAAMTAAG